MMLIHGSTGFPSLSISCTSAQHMGASGRDSSSATQRLMNVGERAVEVPHRAAVLLAAVVGNPLVAAGVGAADLLGAVGRRVVGDDELEVRIVLAQQRVDRDL